MSTYRALKGYSVKSITSDPANTKEGQVWYNSSAKQIKIAPKIGAWASGGNLNTARAYMAGFGTQTAAVSSGGNITAVSALSEEYNGTSWTEGNDLGTARRGLKAAGTLTAGVVFGGSDGSVPTQYALVEEYDGTSYSEVNNLPSNKNNHSGCGTLTAGLSFGGSPDPTSVKTFEYDGTSWTAGGDLNAAGSQQSATGTQTAALGSGGYNVATNEEYDGSSWSEVNNLPASRDGAGTSGPQTAALIFGGHNPGTAAGLALSLNYDGTNFSNGPNLGTARYALGLTSGTAATNTSAIAFGGGTPSNSNATEEFTEVATTRTVDVS